MIVSLALFSFELGRGEEGREWRDVKMKRAVDDVNTLQKNRLVSEWSFCVAVLRRS